MPTLEANGVTTSYVEAGTGPPVVLVHGLGGTHALWAGVMPELANDFHVVAYDLRGSGGSSRPDGPWTLDDLVADLDAVVDAKGMAPAAVVGHSLSGGLVLAYAARHPEKVRAVVGVGAVTELPDAGRQGMRDRAATVRRDGMAEVAVAVATAGVAPSWREGQPAEWDAFRDMLAANDAEAYALQAEIVASLDLASELSRVRSPVLLVGGELDAPSPPALNEANVERLSDATFVQLDDCGHISPLEKPAELLAAALPFLRRTV